MNFTEIRMFFLSGSFPETASESGLIQYPTLMTLAVLPSGPGQGRNCFGILGLCFRLGSSVVLYFWHFNITQWLPW